MNIRLPLVGALGVGPGARTRPHVQAWRVGVTRAAVEPRGKVTKGAWPMNCGKYLKIRAGFLTHTSQAVFMENFMAPSPTSCFYKLIFEETPMQDLL